jgi:hypothetical protein
MKELYDKKETNPSRYQDVSIRLFGKFVGGPCKRFSPPGFHDFNEIFFTSGESSRQRRAAVLSSLKSLVDWSKEHGESASNSAFEHKLQETSLTMREQFCNIPSKFKCDSPELSGFRLILFLQMSFLSGHMQQGGGLLARLHPTEGLGSYQHLVDVGRIDPKDIEVVMRLISDKLCLTPYQPSVIEQLLCESKPNRGDVWDFLIDGCDSFMGIVGSDGMYRAHRKGFDTQIYCAIN